MINEDIFIFDKEDIFGLEETESTYNSEKNSDNSSNNDDIFKIFEYGNIIQEYNFKTKETSLFLKLSEDKYQQLYCREKNDLTENYQLISNNDIFIIQNYNEKTNFIKYLDYMTKYVFSKYLSLFDKDYKNILLKQINDISSTIYIKNNSVRLIENNNYHINYTNKELYDKYKKLFIKYKSSASLIPIKNILHSILFEIYQYIITKNINIDKLKNRLNDLSDFSSLCPYSISLIEKFISDPNSIDLRYLCESLEKNMKNISDLINLYFEEELRLQEKEER